MQTLYSDIHGLAPESDGPARLTWLWAMGLALVVLILASAYLLGAQASSLYEPPGRIDNRPVVYAPPSPAPTPKAGAPQDVLDAQPIGAQVFAALTPEQAQTINASIPVSSNPNPAAQPFVLPATNPVDRLRAQTCLTMAVYYEAASQGDAGEAAVAQVVLNRLRHPLFPKTVCGVVFQGSSLPTGCQFTFTCDGSLNRAPDQNGWKRASKVAVAALNGYVERSVGDATHYHTAWVVPYWQSTVEKVAQLGAHIFYRWAGPMGRPAALIGAYTGAEPLPSGVRGFNLERQDVSLPEATAVTAVVAERDPAPALIKVDLAPPPTEAPQPTAVVLRDPVLPPQMDARTPPSSLDDAQPGLPTNHHLAIPASW